MSEAGGVPRCDNGHGEGTAAGPGGTAAGADGAGARDTVTVTRLDLGYFIRPAAEAGLPYPRVEPALAYLVRHPRGLLARTAAADGAAPPLPPYPAWLDRVGEFGPRRVVFAHDASVRCSGGGPARPGAAGG